MTVSILSVALVSAWSTKEFSPSSLGPKVSMKSSKSSCLWQIKSQQFLMQSHTTTGAISTAPMNTMCHSSECNGNARHETVAFVSTNHQQVQPRVIFNGEQYELMPLPDRGKASTHGALFKESCIERYDVYRRKGSSYGSATSVTNSDSKTTGQYLDSASPDVIAVVTFGSNLDGHTEIVHGGILALMIDDVLGFGYNAILLQEFELSMENSSQTSSSIPETFDPNVVAVTANLNIDFRAPVPANTTVIVEATLVPTNHEQERRRQKNKFHWNITVKSLDYITTYCQASSLYVIPKKQLRIADRKV
jgi:acyl-coenzyme A thioesterase PaaI-like protein